MAADLLAAVARHQADDQGANDGHNHGGVAERRVLQLEFGKRELAEIGDVGGEPDQLQKRYAGEQSRRGNHHGYGGDGQHARVGGEIPEMTVFGMMGLHGWLSGGGRISDLWHGRKRRRALSARYLS